MKHLRSRQRCINLSYVKAPDEGSRCNETSVYIFLHKHCQSQHRRSMNFLMRCCFRRRRRHVQVLKWAHNTCVCMQQYADKLHITVLMALLQRCNIVIQAICQQMTISIEMCMFVFFKAYILYLIRA